MTLLSISQMRWCVYVCIHLGILRTEIASSGPARDNVDDSYSCDVSPYVEQLLQAVESPTYPRYYTTIPVVHACRPTLHCCTSSASCNLWLSRRLSYSISTVYLQQLQPVLPVQSAFYIDPFSRVYIGLTVGLAYTRVICDYNDRFSKCISACMHVKNENYLFHCVANCTSQSFLYSNATIVAMWEHSFF